MAKLSELLKERGYVHQHSSETLEEITDGAKRTVYLGIDPSADSLHVGNLMGLLVLRRFLEDGHKVIIVTGGGTGMIGDPGGKSEERNLLDEETIASNSAAVAAQIRRVFGTSDFIEENNFAWLSKLQLLDFLREVGKHFTVNSMIKKDIVRDRLDAESPISFTEFSYALLQGYDYLHLNQAHGCDVQVGGSDQWSNILAGVEFIRRKSEKTVYALTWPLIVNKATGKKFGKSEQGAVWLDAAKTSPYQMYQFFLNVEDEMAEELLMKLTLLATPEVKHVLMEHAQDGSLRLAQKTLGLAVTTIVHGPEEAARAERISLLLFSETPPTADDWRIIAESAPSTPVQADLPILEALVLAGLASSKREGREFIENGAISLSGIKVEADRALSAADFTDGCALLKRGKRNVAVLKLS